MTRHRRHFHEGGRAMMRIMTILGAVLIGLMHPTASHAGPLDFMFSFTGTVPPGNVAGTVTGEIFGLTNNATGPASNVIVDSDPGLDIPAPRPLIFSDQAFNSFTVVNGAITLADYTANASNALAALALDNGSLNLLINTELVLFVENVDGFAGATYTLIQSTPEPSSVTLLGTGLGFAALWLLRRRLWRRAASA
jgi:hypothetical protein